MVSITWVNKSIADPFIFSSSIVIISLILKCNPLDFLFVEGKMSRQCLSETLSTCERHYPLQHQHQLHHHHQLHQQSQYNHVHNQHQQQSLYGAESDGSSGFLLSGYHKKLKTMKKKYFVLYRDSMDNVARLEYYDNDKKFKSGFDAKRVIKLKNCFNISRRMDTKYEFVIALATKDGGFGIVIESENEMNKWLNNLLSLQRKYCGEFDLPLFGI